MRRSREGLYRRDGILAFRYKDAHGWKEKYTGKTTRSEALQFKEDFLTKLRTGDLPNLKAEQTVEQAVARWVEQHTARLGSAKAKRNEQSLSNQLIRRLGSRKIKSLTLDHLKNYQRERREEVRERTINLELRILRNVLKEANQPRKQTMPGRLHTARRFWLLILDFVALRSNVCNSVPWTLRIAGSAFVGKPLKLMRADGLSS